MYFLLGIFQATFILADIWSKCWLNLSDFALANSSAFFGIPAILATLIPKDLGQLPFANL